MTYFKLKEKLKDYPIFRLEDIFKWFPAEDRRTVIFQLSGWVKKGYLERLKRGIYKLPDYQVEDVFILAGFFVPSYISGESALNYYGIIPDIPFAVTSVTPLKTSTIKTEKYGLFIYQRIKPSLFFGYRTIKSDSLYSYKIANSEKALFDFIYLRSFKKDFNPENYLSEARFNFEKDFNWKSFKKWQKLVPENRKKFHLALKNLFKNYG